MKVKFWHLLVVGFFCGIALGWVTPVKASECLTPASDSRCATA